MTRLRNLSAGFLLLWGAVTSAQGLLDPVTQEQSFLPVDKAFVFQAYASGTGQVMLDWHIAPGYYLYRHRISARSLTPTVALERSPVIERYWKVTAPELSRIAWKV